MENKNGLIVCYVMQNRKNGEEYKDGYKVFIEDENGLPVEVVAATYYSELVDGNLDCDEWKIWSANLCNIINSTEPHYLNI